MKISPAPMISFANSAIVLVDSIGASCLTGVLSAMPSADPDQRLNSRSFGSARVMLCARALCLFFSFKYSDPGRIARVGAFDDLRDPCVPCHLRRILEEGGNGRRHVAVGGPSSGESVFPNSAMSAV